MRQRIRRVTSRARYAAIGGALGAAIGGLFSRNAASTGGALGALVGAAIGETRASPNTLFEQVKQRKDEKLSAELPKTN